MIEIPALEYHAAHGCSLTCEQCSHYSNMRLRGKMPTSNDAAKEFARWTGRVKPKRFAILGGEPALNPRLTEMVRVASVYWSEADKMLVSNGLQLHRHPRLPAMLQHHGWRLDVSQHGTGSSYMKAFSEVLDMLTLWEAMYPGLRIRVRDSFPGWRQQYKTQEGKPKPFDSDPAAAHRICLQRTCHQLYNGRLWKCPALAYFDQIAERTGITGDPDWAPFAGYQGILPDAPEAALAEFANGQPIAACACCPARVIKYPHRDPTLPVV